MFLSEWREFPSAPCLAGKKNRWQLASRCCWNHARPWHSSELVFFLVRLRTYQHPCIGRGSDEAENLTSGEEIVLLLASCNKIPIRLCEHVERCDAETSLLFRLVKFHYHSPSIFTCHSSFSTPLFGLIIQKGERISYFGFNISDLRVGGSPRGKSAASARFKALSHFV